MVAISIDKYLAIMYPMRLRMSKLQSKIIILVIWSAALLTSLPTALLSNLTPQDVAMNVSLPTSITQLVAAPVPTMTSPYPKLQAANYSSSWPEVALNASVAPKMAPNATSSKFKPQPAEPQMRDQIQITTPMQTQTQNQSQTPRIQIQTQDQSQANAQSSSPSPSSRQQQQFQQQEQTKYFCQESWIFWPKGKYYYSMALMILQFVLPLFVLVITYSQIVSAVWGKKIPGEEDNARDARMARSKRKVS